MNFPRTAPRRLIPSPGFSDGVSLDDSSFTPVRVVSSEPIPEANVICYTLEGLAAAVSETTDLTQAQAQMAIGQILKVIGEDEQPQLLKRLGTNVALRLEESV